MGTSVCVHVFVTNEDTNLYYDRYYKVCVCVCVCVCVVVYQAEGFESLKYS